MPDFDDAERAECLRLLEWGLNEDLGDAGDITSNACIPADATGSAVVVVRKSGVLAGLAALPMLAGLRDFGVEVKLLAEDGLIAAAEQVARYSGSLRGILAIERLGLNLVGRLSGVATLTSQYVNAVAGTKAKICDTRKTTPGMRRLEKYAVQMGGGTNHRIGLFDAVLIKDNHLVGLAARGNHPVRTAVESARASVPKNTIVEVEVTTLTELDEALACSPDIVLLDNMNLNQLRESVRRRNERAPKIQLEASGGVNLTSVRAIAETGVDRISVGALTHSAPCLDIALDFED